MAHAPGNGNAALAAVLTHRGQHQTLATPSGMPGFWTVPGDWLQARALCVYRPKKLFEAPPGHTISDATLFSSQTAPFSSAGGVIS